jgi:hypothetical protein
MLVIANILVGWQIENGLCRHVARKQLDAQTQTLRQQRETALGIAKAQTTTTPVWPGSTLQSSDSCGD